MKEVRKDGFFNRRTCNTIIMCIYLMHFVPQLNNYQKYSERELMLISHMVSILNIVFYVMCSNNNF